MRASQRWRSALDDSPRLLNDSSEQAVRPAELPLLAGSYGSPAALPGIKLQ
jgi:hypothetical protein